MAPAVAIGIVGTTACTVPDASGDGVVDAEGVAPPSIVDAPAEAGDPASAGDLPEGGILRSRTPGGTEVVLRRLEPDSGPLVAGPVRWRIETAVDLDRAPTVDLVSPEMPMHGIVRYAGSASDRGGWDVEAPIPMEGRWHLYVNLDDGADAAEFTLDVLPGESGGHAHGTMESAGHEAAGGPGGPGGHAPDAEREGPPMAHH